MLGNPISQTLIGKQLQVQAQSYLEQARLHMTVQSLEMALALYDQAKVTFRHAADAHHLVPLSKVKGALNQARMPQTPEEEVLRQRIAEVYFERGELLKKLGKTDKAQASYKKAQDWGHESIESGLIAFTEYDKPILAQTVTPASMSAEEKGELLDYLFESIVGGQPDARRSEETKWLQFIFTIPK